MKALILAAGTGTRLRPFTERMPKCLVEFRGRPLLDYTLEALTSVGVSDVIVVGGHEIEVLQRYCSSRARVISNPHYASTNMVESLFCAEQEMTEDLLVIYGDIVFVPGVLTTLLACQDRAAVPINLAWRKLWELRMEDPLKDAETLKVNSRGMLVEIGKKPSSYEDIEGQYMGILLLRKESLSSVRRFYHSLPRDEQYDGRSFKQMFMTTFIQRLIESGFEFRAIPVHGGWVEIDSVEDLRSPWE